MPQPFVRGLAPEGAVGAMVVVEALPFSELVVEELGRVDDHAVELAIELLVVDPVRPLDLAIQSWGGRLDVGVAYSRSKRCQWKPDWNSEPLSV